MPTLHALSNETLDQIARTASVPTYDRSRLSPGIVHIGLGNFHRAHQAWYLHRLMQQGLALDWAIIGAGVRPNDEVQRQKLAAQDYLTTLVLLDPNTTSAEVTGSMIGYVPVEDGNGALVAAMAKPNIRIVAMTVTEGGYFLDPADGGFDAENPDVRHDVQNPSRPRTAFGAIIAALAKRRVEGHGPVSLMSCDNLQGNGTILRQTVVSLARLTDADLADWINENCSFPNSMVDCIVPATGPREVAHANEFGIDDKVPVTHEAFRQWVIEDDFCAGRPEWNRVGATFSDRVHSYEAMKLRILNGGHQIVANAGELLSVGTIAECMTHPLIGDYFRKVAIEEIVPYVDAVPDVTPEEYLSLIDKRFSNPKIVDTTRRVAFDGSARHTGFLHPTLRDALKGTGSVSGLALAEALWARMCAGSREDGSEIEPNDPIWDDLKLTALAARHAPVTWLEQSQLYSDLSTETRFADRFCHWLSTIWADGTESVLRAYLAR
ncbi:MAG: mannitol dehydrogenase family protein [Pseudomonadota bacterium]